MAGGAAGRRVGDLLEAQALEGLRDHLRREPLRVAQVLVVGREPLHGGHQSIGLAGKQNIARKASGAALSSVSHAIIAKLDVLQPS